MRFVLAVIVGIALLAGAAPVEAHHIRPISSQPASGATLKAAPREVQVEFDLDFEMPGSGLSLLDQSGNRLERVPAEAQGVRMLRMAVPTFGPGNYQVVWRTLAAADGEFNEGNIPFSVGSDLDLAPSSRMLGSIALALFAFAALTMLGGARPTP